MAAHNSTNSRRKASPLYTSPAAAARKRAFITENGKDADGAFRVYRRLDGVSA